MRMKMRTVLILLIVTTGFLGVSFVSQGVEQAQLSGLVTNATDPVENAHVRVRNTDNLVYTDASGAFTLKGLEPGKEVEVTAWADGYYIAFQKVTPPQSGLKFQLRGLHTQDNPGYEWASPLPEDSDSACGVCHPMIIGEWSANAHGGAVDNPRFFSMYNGKDVSGQSNVAPGYRNAFPGTNGNCANCHAPGAGVDGYMSTNMNDIRGQVTAGIHCDFCHKCNAAYINPATKTVYDNAPGVRSMYVLRPPEGDNVFFGPFDDIHDPDTKAPQMSESAFCAPCHQFSFWGTPIYESYNEWLASDFATKNITCQDCHMPPNGQDMFAVAEQGGLVHDPEDLPSHMQRGARDVALLRDTVTMRLKTKLSAGRLEVTAGLINTGAGHHVPTDYPGRHMILEVRAYDAKGNELTLTEGPVVPSWGGDYAGVPGKGYAKLLQDVFSGEWPVVNYWEQTVIKSDNRLAAGEADTPAFAFSVPDSAGEITVKARLIFRRLFYDMMKAKGWTDPDILMEEISVGVFTESTGS